MRVALIGLLLFFVVAAGGAGAATTVLGDQTIESGHDSNTAGRAEAFRTTATAGGTVTTVTVYVDSTSAATTLSVGLYADAGGHPGALLGSGTKASPVRGAWNDVAIAPATVAGGSQYWIAILSPLGSGTLQFRDSAHTGASETSSSSALSALPSTWSTGVVYRDGPLSAYASADAVSQQPLLEVDPTSVSVSGPAGADEPASAAISVSNGGGGTLSFTATTDAAWLTVDPSAGSAPATVTVSASFATLAPGTYTGHVTVDGGGPQGSPASVTVTATVTPAQTPGPSDWPMVDHDPARTGDAAGETTIGPSTAASLTQSWSTAVDGKITAQPLFLKDVTVENATHDVVVVATSANSVYALDAATGAVLWRRNFGAEAGNCAIPGGFGITGAPAADKANGRLFVVSDDGTLHTVAIADGTDALAPLTVVVQPATNKVWGGLNLVGTDLYVATASDGCDTAPWRGRIYDVSLSGGTARVASTFDVVPGIPAPNGGGGIWGYGGVSAAGGSIFAATGDDSNEGYMPYGDHMIALDSGLSLLGSFLPSEPSTFPCTGAPCDLDFGATPVVFSPPGCPTLTAAGNKNGNLYLFRTADLASSGAPLQTLQLNQANDWLGSGGVGGVPAYWAAGNMLFVSDTGPGFGTAAGGIVGLTVQPDCTLEVAWSATVGGSAKPNSTPTVANGVVFVGEGDNGNVQAFDARTGARLWSSGAVNGSSVYGAPIVADGKLIFGRWNGSAASDGGTVRAFAPGRPDVTPPTVSVTAPASGSTVSGTVTVAATANDDVAVSQVQFELDGAPLGGPVTSSPYSIPWNTATAAGGTHTLTATATDTSGNSTTSTGVTVTVDNAAPPPPPATLVGDSTVERQIDQNTAGRAEAFRTSATATGSVTKLQVYVDSTSTANTVVIGLYADNGGHPGTRLTEGTITAPVKGAWNTVAVPAAAVAAGTSYWFAILGPTGTGTVKFRDKAGGQSETSASGSLTDLPATWSTGTRYGDGPLSAYGVG